MGDDQDCVLSQHPNRLPSHLAFNELIDLGKGELIQEYLHSFPKIDAMFFAIDPRLALVPFKLLHSNPMNHRIVTTKSAYHRITTCNSYGRTLI